MRATFFIVSGHIQHRAQIEAILAEGHGIGHHLVKTRPGWRLGHEEIVRDFDQGAAIPQTDVEVLRYGMATLVRIWTGRSGSSTPSVVITP